MLLIHEIHNGRIIVDDPESIREVIEYGTKCTILAEDEVGQMLLLSSSDYIGEEFKLTDESIIVIN